MKPSLLLGPLVIAAAASVYGQTSAAPPPYVASPMRRNADGIQGGTGFRPGTFVMAGGTIRSIFQLAYPSEGIEAIGAPDWLSTDRFDLTVRFEQERLPPDQVQAVFREIFATQLKMKVHYERRDTPTYSMVVARSDGRLGSGVRKLDTDCDARRDAARRGEKIPELPAAANGVPACQNKVGNGTVQSGGMRFSQLAATVRNPAGRLIVNETGLDGFYEFSLEWAPGPADAASPDQRPNIFTAFEEQLGLKLRPSTTSVEVVVIDHVERPQRP
jgi:uncharacterized protein (TIGR03435 family)